MMSQYNKLQIKRSGKHWTQQELAVRAGVGVATIRRAEQGATIRLSNWLKLAEALGCEPGELLSEREEK